MESLKTPLNTYIKNTLKDKITSLSDFGNLVCALDASKLTKDFIPFDVFNILKAFDNKSAYNGDSRVRIPGTEAIYRQKFEMK